MSVKRSATTTKNIKSVKGATINVPSTAPKKSRKYNGPVMHNIDAVVKWIPVMGHPCFELGLIDECNVPHTPLHLKYPYPIRSDSRPVYTSFRSIFVPPLMILTTKDFINL